MNAVKGISARPRSPHAIVRRATVSRAWKSAVMSLALLAVTAAAAPAANDAGDAAAIAALLHTSAAAWNRDQLDEFMKSYEDSPSTTYANEKTILHGYGAIRAHYAAAYGRGHSGTLALSDLAVRLLGADYAVVFARWHLAMRDGTHPSGIFSLVLHRGPTGWRIIDDHSP